MAKISVLFRGKMKRQFCIFFLLQKKGLYDLYHITLHKIYYSRFSITWTPRGNHSSFREAKRPKILSRDQKNVRVMETFKLRMFELWIVDCETFYANRLSLAIIVKWWAPISNRRSAQVCLQNWTLSYSAGNIWLKSTLILWYIFQNFLDLAELL